MKIGTLVKSIYYHELNYFLYQRDNIEYLVNGDGFNWSNIGLYTTNFYTSIFAE